VVQTLKEAKGHNRVVFNFAEVAYIDSSGIGELVAACTSIINQGGSVKLLNLNERVRTVFNMTKLHTVFPIFDDEKTALTSFN
jgi:anti-sigma B factor antagonist